jgi:phosphate transport system substrate-binding protein
VVHPHNPITQLNKAQVARVFSGDAKNWQEFGGKDQAIHLYARDENSGTWDSFKNMVLGKSSPLSPDAQRYESSEALVSKVVSDPGGIGFIGLAFVGASKLLAISDGQAAFKPSLLTVATEDYALSRRLFLYTKGESSNVYVREFIAFCQGVSGQEIVEKQGFISQNVAAMNTQLADDLPAEYLEIVQGNQRLSVNFRFQPGSAKLDNKASKDIQRLVYFIKQQEQPKEIILIGFGDRRKNAQRSKLLSKLRAMAVRRELARLGVYAKLSTGYGEFNPLASYQSRSGKIKNRRVEVWLR